MITPPLPPWVPSCQCTVSLLTSAAPQAIYFSTGFHSYRRLDPDKVGRVLADYSAGYALPYLVGSGDVVAQYYEDETVARTTYKKWQLIGPLLGILILGIIGELFVPVLPGDIPRREFGIYSWLALLQYQACGHRHAPRARANRSLTLRSCS